MPISTSTKIRQYITSLNSRLYAWRFLQYAWSTCFHICSYTLREDAVETQLGAPCALCARRRCAVTTLCTPRACRERSVTTQSIAGQNSVGARWHAVGAPRKRHCRRGRAVTSPRYGKCKMIRYIFLVFSCDPTALWKISNRHANAVGSQ